MNQSDSGIIADLVAIRCARGLTQKQVAETMQLVPQSVYQFEQTRFNRRSVTLAKLLSYAHAVGAEININPQGSDQ